MAIILFSDRDTLVEQSPQVAAFTNQGERWLTVLLKAPANLTAPTSTGPQPPTPDKPDVETDSATALQAILPDMIVLDVGDPRFNRLNFDTIGLLILDLPPQMLLSSGGRRLLDVLGRLAEEDLTLAFWGSAVGMIGSFLQDGVTAALNLIPKTVVIPNVQAVVDLRALLERLNQSGQRLLALDGAVSAFYTHHNDTIQVNGAGNVLLTAFHPEKQAETEAKAKLQMLTGGMQGRWPS